MSLPRSRSAPLVALLCVLLAPLALLAQAPEAAAPSEPPTIPDTVVETTPPEAETAEPYPYTDNFFEPSILDGTIFDSPPVDGYNAQSSTTGTIINIPDADLPATVNTITRDLMDDQIALRISDVYRNAGGVNLLGDSQFYDRLLLRGQQVGSGNYRKDGFIDRTSVPRDFQNVERIEILKGPASVLYGAGDAAGLINLITKKPVNDRFANFGYVFGSYQQQRFTMDANGVSQSGDVLYRLNIAQEDSDNFVDFDYLSRTQIAPVITWLVDDSTSITWNGEWHRDNRRGFQGTPALGTNALALPPSRFVGNPNLDYFESEEFRQSLVLKHEINDCWFYTIGGYSLFDSAPQTTTAATSFAPNIPDPPQPFFNQLESQVPYQDEQCHSMIANLGGEFWTGDWRHKTLVGMEYAYLDSESLFNANLPFTPVNAAMPSYAYFGSVPLFGLQTNAFRQQRVGGYLQDLVQINPYWQVLGGVRFDTLDFQFDRIVNVNGQPGSPFALEDTQTFNRVSPRGGVVYQPLGNDLLSFYYSYSQSFAPPGGGAYFTATPLNPVLGESHEAGIKTLLLENLTLTAAGYHTVRENDTFVLTPSNITQVGEVRSQGVELNLLGELTPYWSVVANYCYCDARVYDAALGLDGAKARNVPFNTANLWTRYNFYDDCCQTVGAALGVVYVGEREASLFPTGVDLPTYTRWDAGVYYRYQQWNASVFLENLFDEQYAQSSANQYQIWQGAPFNGRAMITYSY